MGTKSYGKGVVQTIQEVRNGSAVKLTTARYFTPNGRSIQAKGIDPDIVLSTLSVDAKDSRNQSFSEKDLDGRLSNPNGEEDTNSDAGDGADQKDAESLAQTDLQLYEALNLLKGLYIMNQLKSG